MSTDSLQRRVEAVRRFNRFFTRQIGLLQEGLLRSPFSLTEARVIYELAQHERASPGQLAQELGIDPGYMSRIVKSLTDRGLVERAPSETDGRQSILSLSPPGREAFARLDEDSRAQIGAMLSRLAPGDQERLVAEMGRIERLLGDAEPPRVPYVLRPPRPGDLGWVVHRHGVLYSQEYGWDERFEGLVAELVAHFVRDFDAARERCWIVEREGDLAGSVFLVRYPERPGVAKLRLLLVEPSARGLGIGKRLVEECTRFARQAGYHTITLWTNSVLVSARRLYEAEGYRLVSEEPHQMFGPAHLVGQTWELTL